MYAIVFSIVVIVIIAICAMILCPPPGRER